METELEDRPTTALTVQQRAVLALGSDKAREELAALAAKSADIKEVKNVAGRDQAHAAGMVLVRTRVDIEKRGKAARDDATKFSKAVIAEEKALIAIIEPEEQRVLALRDEWDKARAAERAEAERKERERVESIRLRIADIREAAVLASQCRTSAAMRELLQKLVADPLEGFAEFQDEAIAVRDGALERIRTLITGKESEEAEAQRLKEEQEAERQRLAAERAELERQRLEAEAAAKAERDRVAAESAAQEARLAEARRAFEAEQAQARAEAAKRDAEDRARRDEEDRKAREARAADERRLAEERAELERQQRALREAEEAKAAEARRIAQEAADAAAAAERKRLDDEAAAARAERQRQAEAEEAERVADKRVRDAAPALLRALRAMVHKATKQNWNDQYPDELAQALEAIALATGEPA